MGSVPTNQFLIFAHYLLRQSALCFSRHLCTIHRCVAKKFKHSVYIFKIETGTDTPESCRTKYSLSRPSTFRTALSNFPPGLPKKSIIYLHFISAGSYSPLLTVGLSGKPQCLLSWHRNQRKRYKSRSSAWIMRSSCLKPMRGNRIYKNLFITSCCFFINKSVSIIDVSWIY